MYDDRLKPSYCNLSESSAVPILTASPPSIDTIRLPLPSLEIISNFDKFVCNTLPSERLSVFQPSFASLLIGTFSNLPVFSFTVAIEKP